MRSDREVLAMLLAEAQGDERIRTVYMNGSRVNPNARKDILRDYDVVLVVTELAPYLEPGWIDRFGEILILQEPDKMDVLVGQEHDFSKRYAYLMQSSWIWWPGTRPWTGASASTWARAATACGRR
ncbi:MAG TPA: aminoglycoside 6-adenylyltransferase [Clostridia bacterium]|nr:aminoglycoside 6-adenylyltransferase [Clostridia bacterium]